MLFQINIECSPEEARRFFGVPELLPLQQAMMDQLNTSMSENIKKIDPSSPAAVWAPAMMQGLQSWNDMQQNFWKQMASGNFGAVNINTGTEAKTSKK